MDPIWILALLNVVVLIISGMDARSKQDLRTTLTEIKESVFLSINEHSKLKDELKDFKTEVAKTYMKESTMENVRKEVLARIDKLDRDNKDLISGFESRINAKQDK